MNLGYLFYILLVVASVVPARPRRNEVLFQIKTRVCLVKINQNGKVSLKLFYKELVILVIELIYLYDFIKYKTQNTI